MSIADLSRLIARRELSPVEVTQAVLERIQKHDPDIRAYITVTTDIAIEQAGTAESEITAGRYLGPMHGIPFSLKDNIETSGVRTSCASMVNPDWIPDRDATVYARLLDAGAVLVGKANLFEYAFSMNPAYPATINPWNSAKSSSGSSSGSAVSVATGMAYASLGTDTGGSGRSPASVNGVVGLKPTYGRVSRSGIVPMSYSLDQASTMTRTVEDAAIVLQAISGRDPADPSSSDEPVSDFRSLIDHGVDGLRVGWATGYTHESIDPEVDAVIETAVDVLRQAGAIVTSVELPFVRQCGALQMAIMYSEVAAVHYHNHRRHPDRFGEAAFDRLDLGSTIPATDYIRAQQARTIMRDRFRELFEHVDVVVGPTIPGRTGPAGSWYTVIDGVEIDIREAGPEYTGIYNLAGLPAIVVPAGFSGEGTPVGLQFAAPWFEEATLVRVGATYERLSGWRSLRPPLPDRQA